MGGAGWVARADPTEPPRVVPAVPDGPSERVPPPDGPPPPEAPVGRRSVGEGEAAEQSLRRKLEQAPDDPELRAALGRILERRGRIAEAVTEYRRALAASPEDAATHARLGLALRALGDLAGAGQHLSRSLAIEPRCDVYADFGLLQDLLGREDLAHDSYEKGIALGDGCSAARMNLASMLLEDGRYEEAADHYRAVVEREPSAQAHSGLGFALNQLGRLKEAAAEHDAAVAIDASLAGVHRNRALTQARLGDYEEAIRSYRRAVAIEPRVSTYYSLAGVLRAAGRGDEAEVEYRRGRELAGRRREAGPGDSAADASSRAGRTSAPHGRGGRAGTPE